MMTNERYFRFLFAVRVGRGPENTKDISIPVVFSKCLEIFKTAHVLNLSCPYMNQTIARNW